MCKGIIGCLLCGDFNWQDPKDGNALAFVEPQGEWLDVWEEASSDNPGFTYDGKLNGMLAHRWRNRFDRILMHGSAIAWGNAHLIGTEKVEGGLTYEKRTKSGGTRVLPVFPSDHFGVCEDFVVV